MSSYQIDITCNRSATTKSTAPNSNFSTETSVYAEKLYNGGAVPDTEQHASLGFDLSSSLPSLLGRRITRVILFIYFASGQNTGGEGSYFKINPIFGAWNEGSITFNNQPSHANSTYYGPYNEARYPSIGWVNMSWGMNKSLYDAGFLLNGNGIRVTAQWGYSPPGGGGRMYGVFNSSRAASNKPYVRIEMQDAIPTIYNATAGYVNPAIDNQLQWGVRDADYNGYYVHGGIQTSGSKFRWRIQGAGTYTEIALANNQHTLVIPAGTLPPDSTIEWQVIEKTTDGVSTSADAWYVVTTYDAIPLKPTSLGPNGAYVAVDEDNVFSWQHNIDTGTVQTKADLQYALNNGAWQQFGSVIGAGQSIVIPANTLPSGRIQWRVRTYNTDNIAGEWADPISIVGVGAPAAPNITDITASNRPAVSWQSLGQIAYQVQIGSYDSGEVAGAAKRHKIPYYIPNGVYPVRVRIKGASLLWSAWAERELTLAVTGPAKPIITAEAITGAAALSFSAPTAAKLYLLRNSMPIADVTGLATYTDHAVSGSVVYILRAVDALDNYTDSDAAGVIVSVPHALLAAVDDLDNPVPLKLTRGEPRRITGNKSRDVTYQHYAGRELPVARYSGHSTGSYELTVAFLRTYDRDRLLALLDRCKTMLYRDAWGNRWYVTVGSNGYEQDRIATSISLPMTVTDYVEQIAYEV